MEYVYAGLLLHYAKKEINEDNLTKVFQSAGIPYDENKLKMFAAALKEINIEETLKSATALPAAVTATPQQTTAPAEAKKEEKKEEEVSEETLSAGLSALFG
jgi:large subunit ribosomal protein L12